MYEELIWTNLNTSNDIASVEAGSKLETLVRSMRHNKPSSRNE